MRGSPRKFDTKDCQNMAIVTGDRYLEFLVKFVEKEAGPLIEGTLVLKLNPVGLHYVQSRLEALQELEGLLAGAPVDYLRAYISDLGDHRALEQLRRILRLLTSLKVVSVLPPPARDPTPLSLLPFGRLKVLELRGCDLSTSAAKGLLELRHTLERITCHNSTDALRHVFASRIVDIKNSPVWNRLSFVSCACNDLVLMDESLQLLPVVETLDLSRNRFAKVDNLRKCAKLRHLDLGFNHLKSISSFSEVACPIVKLVLRHNALTTLRGVENLKFLEGLDLSYNVISSFSELCVLATLPSLQSLWLEGNPICCARWYRAQVFAIFTYPERLTLDEKEITTKESWKRQIILASRQKKPAGFGFYSPARDNAEEEGNLNTKRKKLCRLAMIEDDECKILTGLEATEQESPSCDSDIRSREENAVSDGEAEIVGLMNRVEFMKKERSVLWLREIKDWMDHPPEEITESKFSGLTGCDGEEHVNTTNGHKHLGERSSYVSDSAQASGDESSTNVLESDNSYADSFIGLHGYKYFSSIGEATSVSMIDSSRDGIPILMVGENDRNQEKLKPHTHEHVNHLHKAMDAHLPDAVSLQKGDVTDLKHATPLKAIDEIMDSHSSSTFPGSPPHYKEDILHRRHNLEEEFMQLSAESYSLVSSDTDTSSSDDDFYKLDSSLPRVDEALNDQSSKIIMDDQLVLSNYSSDRKHDMSYICQNGRHSFDPKPIDVMESNADCLHADGVDHDFHAVSQEMGCLEKKRRNWKSKRRIISLCEEIFRQDGMEPLSQGQNDTSKVSVADMDQISLPSSSLENYSETFPISKPIFSQFFTEDFIKNYFDLHVAHSSSSETCLHYMICTSILQKDSRWIESEVIILQSSEDKLYILLVDTISDGSGLAFDVIGCHGLGEINEVVFGLGLQILRVHIGKDASYVFITGNIEKSRRLITILGICDFRDTYDRCSLRSVEQAQIELFEKHICGSSKLNIFLYSMLLFWCTNSEKESWLSRSLFVIKGYVLVCIEDLMQFGSIELADDASSIPYFCLDSCCPISNISEMVIEPKKSLCQMTLSTECVVSRKFSISGNDPELPKMEPALERVAVGSCTWKLKWFSEQALLTFVSLLKALHAETGVSPLPVRCIS